MRWSQCLRDDVSCTESKSEWVTVNGFGVSVAVENMGWVDSEDNIHSEWRESPESDQYAVNVGNTKNVEKSDVKNNGNGSFGVYFNEKAEAMTYCLFLISVHLIASSLCLGEWRECIIGGNNNNITVSFGFAMSHKICGSEFIEFGFRVPDTPIMINGKMSAMIDGVERCSFARRSPFVFGKMNKNEMNIN